MKNIIKFAVGNPVTICMIVFALLLLGKVSYDQLSVDLLPDLNNPRLFIELKAGERPPEEIEKQFVKNMESMVIRQSDVTQVSSVIKAGTARITVEYTWTKDMDEAFLDLQKAMNPFAQNKEITELKITQHDANLSPVVLIGMSHQNITDMAELRKIADSYIRNELIRLEGVADVTLSGEEVTTLTVQTDPYKLGAFQLKIEDIASRIESNNQSISGGRVSELGLQYLVKSSSLFSTEADFENLIVGYKPVQQQETSGNSSSETVIDVNKAPIFLKEIATVQFMNARPENIVRINGKRSIGLSIYKEMRFNTVKVVDEVSKRLAVIEDALPGYHFQVISNQGTFIKNAIGEVKSSAVLGIVLAIIVLFVFLRRMGTTLIVSLSIPISIVATFNLMFFNGLTLNIMTLGGLALGAGMLVDNAIVVIESIFRNQEKGMSVHQAVITGTAEVANAVIASTLTTIVVFLPIVYLHGASGELFKDQAWTVTFSLVSSLFVAILVIPMLYVQLSGKKVKMEEVKSIRITRYSKILRKLVQHRWWVIGVAVLLLVVTGLLTPFIGTEFMPRAESKVFTAVVKMPEGTPMERTAAAIGNLEDLLYTIVGGDSLCTLYSHIGEGSGSVNAIFEGENTAMMKVILSPECILSPERVIAQFIEEAKNPDGLELSIRQDENSLSSLLGSEGAPIVVEVKGEELDEVAQITEEVKERMLRVEGLYDVVTSIEDGAPEVVISIDRTIAGINNLSVATVIEQLKQQLSGKEVGKMEYRGEMRDIVIKVPDISLGSLGALVIRSGAQEFLLHEIATITYGQAPKEILRRNQSRISKIMANMDAGKSLDKMAAEVRLAVKDIDLPANYHITVTGEEEKRQESMHSLLFALLLSVVLVYMVMASQFESLLHPFTILLTIPLAVVGAVLLFFITGTTINMMGVIGIVMLGGIAVNNSIILVDRINQLSQAGMELTDAIVEAGQQRIRPIIMTTLTTILAMFPMTFGFGEGASLRSPMAIAVIGGLITSTLMSLMVIPCVYYVLEKMKRRINH
ncbi:efflux RND transporter permease subunit [Bacteroides caecimuris]|jgi:HAE1 family hydrophobic/amphiphilic exporter-1|uniref:Acriflavine resistance protein B n=1 Tax=Bacteroides caecimuris TaxID=1796613 RepID=A0A1C7GXZ5_9BACE|nr:efflux RND transporter permease subunit [Bacteroides caecimuris]ANU57235.1 acriflavine resistance protein B [Bacteroides caecimuris]OXE64678.1 AcrB/AcrD/AcrF family protein [Bacteroides caecimuris]QQR17894.1 efflux RND transporter permease subunit [Bacteroides caecimuris]UQA30893.1 efflux RND transporter permease subunit [Bacteroides caecimuris]